MKYSLSAQQALIQDTFGRFFQDRSPAESIDVAAGPSAAHQLWQEFVRLGGLGVDNQDLTTVERALVIEQAGRRLARLPAIESWMAADCLRLRDSGECGALLERMADGSLIASFARQPLAPGRRELVSYGRIADVLIGLAGEELAVFERHQVAEAQGKLGQNLLAYWRVGTPRFVIHSSSSSRCRFENLVVKWRALTGASLVGLAARAVEIGAEYASSRQAFEVPIGTFQGVSHALADASVLVEGARLLTLEAAWAIDKGIEEADLLARMALTAARDAATSATRAAVHVHGGYGITTEHEIQRYYRFAKVLGAVADDPELERLEIGLGLLKRGDAALPPFVFYSSEETSWEDDGIGFSFGLEDKRFRDGLREFLAENRTSMESGKTDSRTDTDEHSPDFHAALGRAGLIGMSWPKEYGGREENALRMMIFADELRRVGYWSNALGTSRLVGETLIVVGTDEQKRRFLPKITSGELTIALGYTEPGSGSDAAAARTRAVQDGDEWVINGQKMFTTSAHFADYVFLLARTNTGVPKTRGLTMFLVPLHAPGVEVSPIHTIGDERTNVTFYSDVRIPDSLRVGAIDGGWKVMGAALKNEHNGGFGWLLARLLAAGVKWAGGSHERRASATVLSRLAEAAIATEVSKLLNTRVAWIRAAGEPESRALGPMSKLYSGESCVRISSSFFDMLGPESFPPEGEEDWPGSTIEFLFRVAPGTTTYGGTSEVMRSLIAEQHLGLPRSR